MNKIYCSVLIVAFLVLVGVAIYIIFPPDQTPPDGNWYCGELGLNLCYCEGDCSMGGTYVWDNGNRVKCVVFDRRIKRFSVTCNEKTENLKPGDEMFSGEVIEFDDVLMFVLEYKTRKVHIFVRTDR